MVKLLLYRNYQDTIKNGSVKGCDSIFTIQLSISNQLFNKQLMLLFVVELPTNYQTGILQT
ncbi:MAG: hypothetical protein R2801_08445 [Chitinophagales bacterium]